MRTPLPVLAILIAYLVFSLKIGPAFMENRPAFKLKMPLLIYNTAQVLYSGYLFWNVSTFLFFNYHTVIMIAIIFHLQMSPTTGQRPLLLTFISPYPELYLAHHSIPHRHQKKHGSQSCGTHYPADMSGPVPFKLGRRFSHQRLT